MSSLTSLLSTENGTCWNWDERERAYSCTTNVWSVLCAMTYRGTLIRGRLCTSDTNCTPGELKHPRPWMQRTCQMVKNERNLASQYAQKSASDARWSTRNDNGHTLNTGSHVLASSDTARTFQTSRIRYIRNPSSVQCQVSGSEIFQHVRNDWFVRSE